MRHARGGEEWAWAGASEGTWAARLGVPALELHRELPSTNGRLAELARSGTPPFTTVVAASQSRGRGRGGKSWHSPPGAGLWLSCLLPTGSVGSAGVLPLAAGVAAARALERTAAVSPTLKWPNDLLLGTGKVGGILCEVVGEAQGSVVLGIGINLRRPPEGYPGGFRWEVAFLEEFADAAVPEPALAELLLRELRRWAFPAPLLLAGRLREEWEARDFLRGRLVRLENGARGMVESVSPEGRLVVTDARGRRLEALAGEVHLAPPEPTVAEAPAMSSGPDEEES